MAHIANELLHNSCQTTGPTVHLTVMNCHHHQIGYYINAELSILIVENSVVPCQMLMLIASIGYILNKVKLYVGFYFARKIKLSH